MISQGFGLKYMHADLCLPLWLSFIELYYFCILRNTCSMHAAMVLKEQKKVTQNIETGKNESCT